MLKIPRYVVSLSVVQQSRHQPVQTMHAPQSGPQGSSRLCVADPGLGGASQIPAGPHARSGAQTQFVQSSACGRSRGVGDRRDITLTSNSPHCRQHKPLSASLKVQSHSFPSRPFLPGFPFISASCRPPSRVCFYLFFGLCDQHLSARSLKAAGVTIGKRGRRPSSHTNWAIPADLKPEREAEGKDRDQGSLNQRFEGRATGCQHRQSTCGWLALERPAGREELIERHAKCIHL